MQLVDFGKVFTYFNFPLINNLIWPKIQNENNFFAIFLKSKTPCVSRNLRFLACLAECKTYHWIRRSGILRRCGRGNRPRELVENTVHGVVPFHFVDDSHHHGADKIFVI